MPEGDGQGKSRSITQTRIKRGSHIEEEENAGRGKTQEEVVKAASVAVAAMELITAV